jgi:pimeloyl-ACP methyl ester carboxylesterase
LSEPASAEALVHERRGRGEPLVLIHGTGSRWQVWSPVLDRLVVHREVIAVDLPGFGASEEDGTAPTVKGFASRLEAFFEAVEVETPHVAGFSLGGGIALELVRRGAARSATAFSPIGFWTPKEIAWCQRLLGDSRRRARVLRPLLPALFRLTPVRALFWIYLFGRPWTLSAKEGVATTDAALGAANFYPTLAGFSDHRFESPDELGNAPVLIAWGNRDLLLPVRQASRAERVLPRARHVRLPGCGHIPFQDDPDLCAALLLEGSPTIPPGSA